MVQDIFNEFARFAQVESMAIGGSRALKKNDVYSDYDVYVYCKEQIPVEDRKAALEKHKALAGCTTCMWHSLLTGRIAYDKGGRLAQAKQKFMIRYPQPLKQNIISHNMQLIKYGMNTYLGQITKAMKRGDLVSINQEVHKFLASYFDVIFAMNEKLHPGEKRLLDICVKECRVLPDDFERNIRALLLNMCKDPTAISFVNTMIMELEKVLGQEL